MTDHRQQFVSNDEEPLNIELFAKYATIYLYPLEEQEWKNRAIEALKQHERKMGPDKARKSMRKILAFSLLLPTFDRNFRPDVQTPESVMFWAPSSNLYDRKQWVSDLRGVVRRDIQIEQWRKQCIELGYIDPIDRQPFTRQGFNWLMDKGSNQKLAPGHDRKEELSTKFGNMVRIYGGAVVSQMFTQHESKVANIVNWHSGYFFERMIFEVYNIDQIKKIKGHEINQTNKRYVQKVSA